jgi:hypothetical protein
MPNIVDKFLEYSGIPEKYLDLEAVESARKYAGETVDVQIFEGFGASEVSRLPVEYLAGVGEVTERNLPPADDPLAPHPNDPFTLDPELFSNEGIVGVTATRHGLTYIQKFRLSMLFSNEIKLKTLHYGMCVGGDDEIYLLVKDLFADTVRIEGHPPADKRYYSPRPVDRLWPEKPYLERNQDIVDKCGLLVAAPRYDHPEVRSGTWATIRRALKADKQILIVWPNGRLEEWKK